MDCGMESAPGGGAAPWATWYVWLGYSRYVVTTELSPLKGFGS